MSNASDDLPDPDTPVTTVTRPTGMSTSKPCKLCSRAPTIRMTAGADMTEPTNLQKSAGQDYVITPIALRGAVRYAATAVPGPSTAGAAPTIDAGCIAGRWRRTT